MTRQIYLFWRALTTFVLPQKLKNNKSVLFYPGKNAKQPSILIIPGYCQSARSWVKIAKLLSTSFNVTILELPHQGRRMLETRDWDSSNFANYVEKFIQTHFKKKIILLGHSLGGKVATIVSQDMKTQIDRLFIYGVGGVTARIPISARLIALLKIPFSPTKRLNFQDIYGKTTVPTSLIYGEYDLITPKEFGEKINKLISKSTLNIIPGTTHLAHEEEPEIFCQIIFKELKTWQKKS